MSSTDKFGSKKCIHFIGNKSRSIYLIMRLAVKEGFKEATDTELV